MRDPLSDSLWKAEGKCYDVPTTKSDYVLWESFFADSVEDRQLALKFCDGCDVQQRCLRFALESQQLWGVWGGRDESEIRRDLWTNSNGSIGGRARWPRCAWCRDKGDTLKVVNESTYQVECTSCGFSWKSETTCMGLEAKHKEQL